MFITWNKLCGAIAKECFRKCVNLTFKDINLVKNIFLTSSCLTDLKIEQHCGTRYFLENNCLIVSLFCHSFTQYILGNASY